MDNTICQLLPRLLLIIPDKDIVNELHVQGIDSSIVLGAVLHNIIKQIENITYRYRQSLIEKKTGAVIGDEYLKIVGIHMLKCPKLNLPVPLSMFT